MQQQKPQGNKVRKAMQRAKYHQQEGRRLPIKPWPSRRAAA
jgi:hypothetical protein